MTEQNIQKFLHANIDYFLTLVKSAGSKVLQYYKSANLQVELKADSSPLTLADKESNKILCDGLAEFGYPIISEETELMPWHRRQNANNLWIIDPLDGTRSFVNKEDEFTINLAFLHAGQPIFGIIYAPVLDEMCWNLSNNVFWQKGDLRQKLAKPLAAKIPRVFVSKTSSNNLATKDFLENLGKYKLVKASSSWKFCELAKGNAEIYPRFGTTYEWDIAAGDAILRALGGKVVNATTGSQLIYNKENLKNPHFIARI